jgi:hypothetical protein
MSDVKPRPVRKPLEEIRMKKVFGTQRLKDLYFYPTDETDAEGIFLLSNKHDETLTLVKSGQPFIFEHDGLVWRVPNPQEGSEPFSIDREIATGSFSNNAKSFFGKPEYPDIEEDGTFTAQAGGQDEDASAASAGAS